MSLFAISRLAYCVRYHSVMSALTEASHQVHSGIDDSPCQIAAKRGNKHGADLHMIRSRDTDGARDGQCHYQAEKNFGEPFNRCEYTPKQPHGIPRRTCILLWVRRCLQASTNEFAENRSFEELARRFLLLRPELQHFGRRYVR